MCLHPSSYPPSSGHRPFITTTARTALRRDGRNGCKHGDVERRLDDWHKAGWPKRANCSNESVMVRLPYQQSADRLPTFPVVFFSLLASISSTRWMHSSSRMYTHISECNSFISLSDGLAVYTFPLYNTLAVQKRLACSTEPVRAPNPSNATTLPLKRASPGYATNCACDVERRLAHASFGLLLPHHELLRHLLW